MEAEQAILDTLAGRARAGTRFTNGEVLTDLLRGYTCVMVSVSDSTGWLNIANDLYRTPGFPVTAWQIVWPDAQHRMPWDSGYSRVGQPVLGEPPEA